MGKELSTWNTRVLGILSKVDSASTVKCMEIPLIPCLLFMESIDIGPDHLASI